MADVTTTANQALLDAAEWAGVSVWAIIAAIAVALLIVIILAFYWIKQRESPIKIYATRGEAGDEALEFVEKTLVEFPADQIKIETTKGKVVIKLVSPKPVTTGEPLLPQEVKGAPLPSKIEEPAPEKKLSESEPIPMGAVESAPEEQKPKKSKKARKKPKKTK